MRLSRCSRSTRDDASCCQPCLSAPGSNSSGSLWTGTEHATRVGRNLPHQTIVCVRCWLQTGQVNHSRPPRQPQCCWPLPDASGGSWRGSPPKWPRTALRNPNPPRTKRASRHPWLPDRTVQGGPPGWCSNIATNHGHVLLRICAPSPVSQPARGMWHGHSHNATREPRPTARPEVWESAPAESHGTGKFWPSLHKFIMAKWGAQHLDALRRKGQVSA